MFKHPETGRAAIVSDILPPGANVEQRHCEGIEEARVFVSHETNENGQEHYAAFFQVELAYDAFIQVLNAISHPDCISNIYAVYGDYQPMFRHHKLKQPSAFSRHFTPDHQGNDLWPYFFSFLQDHGADFLSITNPNAAYPTRARYSQKLVCNVISYPELSTHEYQEIGTRNSNKLPTPETLAVLFARPVMKEKLFAFLELQCESFAHDQSRLNCLKNLLIYQSENSSLLDQEKTLRNVIHFITHNHRIVRRYPKGVPVDRFVFFQNFLDFCHDEKANLMYKVQALQKNGYRLVEPSDREAYFLKALDFVPADLPESFPYETEDFTIVYRRENGNKGEILYTPDETTLHYKYLPTSLFPLLTWTVKDGQRELLHPKRSKDAGVNYSTLLGILVFAYLTPEIHTTLPSKVFTVDKNGRTKEQMRGPVQMTVEVMRPHLKSRLEQSNALLMLERYATQSE